jgi:AcrR family transcriptional regulator
VTHIAERRNKDKIARRQVDRFAERRAELAAAALQTLAELGVARTSLRDIAQNSQFSHGVLHYYFSDKIELITCCVRQYKAECVKRYDGIVASSGSAEDLKEGFGALMAASLRQDAKMHRLWYDLRTQSLFEDTFRADVEEIDQSMERMIWRIVRKYAELTGMAVAVSKAAAYALYDGLFQHALFRYLAGEDSAADVLDHNVRRLLDSLVGGGQRLGGAVRPLP